MVWDLTSGYVSSCLSPKASQWVGTSHGTMPQSGSVQEVPVLMLGFHQARGTAIQSGQTRAVSAPLICLVSTSTGLMLRRQVTIGKFLPVLSLYQSWDTLIQPGYIGEATITILELHHSQVTAHCRVMSENSLLLRTSLRRLSHDRRTLEDSLLLCLVHSKSRTSPHGQLSYYS